jgi:hypothetical protein
MQNEDAIDHAGLKQLVDQPTHPEGHPHHGHVVAGVSASSSGSPALIRRTTLTTARGFWYAKAGCAGHNLR